MADKDLQDQYEDDFDSNDSEYFDEFDDAGTSVDDGDWDEMDDDVDGDYQQPAPQKKKSSFLTYLIIGIVVLGGGAFAVSQMGSDEEVTGTEVADTEMPAVGDVSAEAPTTDVEQSQSAAVDDSAQMPVPALTGDAGAVAETSTPAPTEGSFVPLTPDTDMAAPEGQAVTDATPPSLPEIGGGLMTVPDMAAPTMEAPAPTDMAAEGTDDQRPNDFPSVDMIKRTDKQTAEVVALDQAAEPTTQVGDVVPLSVQAEPDVPSVAPQVEPIPVAQADTPVVSSEASTGDNLMKAEMRKAVDQIAELQATVEKQEEQRSDYVSQISDLKQQVSDLEAKLARSSERGIAPVSASSPKSMPRGSSEPQESMAVQSSKTGKVPVWVLKSAQKSRALLSREGQSDIRTVAVGDKVPGLGTILSIEQGQYGWAVVGTSGRVTE